MTQEWIYNGKIFIPPEDFSPKVFYSFVYLIENLANGKSYVGKKTFWSLKTRQVKGKKKKYKAESDWREYYGSSEHLHKDIEHYGTRVFRRTILHLCKTKGDASYLELYEQIKRNVLFDENYYNGIIQCRIHASHIKNLREEFIDRQHQDSQML